MLSDFFKEGIGEIPGLFNLTHLLYLLIALLFIGTVLFLTKNKSKEKLLKYIKCIAVGALIAEILKIIWNITIREDAIFEDYFPLYFCSFFIYTSLYFAFSQKRKGIVYQFSMQFLFYGGILGGLTFTILPTTSLQVFPLLHILSLHSLIYHCLMVIVGVWMLRFFTPQLKDIRVYGLWLLIIELLIIIINYITDMNFMKLNEPYGLAFFEFIASVTGLFFPYVMAIGQMGLSFYLGYLLSLGLKKIYSGSNEVQK